MWLNNLGSYLWLKSHISHVINSHDFYLPLFPTWRASFLSSLTPSNSIDWHASPISFPGNFAPLILFTLRISKSCCVFQIEEVRWTIDLSWHLMLLCFLSIMLQRVLSFVREINQNFCPGSCCFLFVLPWILTVRLFLWPPHSECICAL